MLPVDEARAQTRSAHLAGGDTCTDNIGSTGETCTIEAGGGTATFTLTYVSVMKDYTANFTVPSDVGLTNTDPAKYVIEAMGDMGDVTLTRLPVGSNALLTTTFSTAGSGTVTYTVRTTERASVDNNDSFSIRYSGGTRNEDLPRSGGPLTFTVVASTPDYSSITPTDLTFTVDTLATPTTLPAAVGGTGTVTYSLGPLAALTALTDTDISVSVDDTMPLILTGTPTETLAETEFTLTATDTNLATAELTFNITITENVNPVEVKAEVETVATLVGAVQTGLTAGLVRSRFSVQPSSGVAGRDTPDANGATGGATTSLTLPDNPRDLADILGGLALEHTADADSGGQYAVWVRGQYTSMDGDPTLNGITVNYDGNSAGLGVGAEKSTGRYVAGVAVNWLATDLDISSSSDDTTLSKYEESLVMVAPYVSLRRGARTFWFSGGYGIGDADATLEEGEGKASADVEVSFASAGADFVLSERGKNRIIGGLSVLGTRKVVDPLNFAAADVVIPKITLNTFRAQGELTYSRTVQAGEGRVVRPYIGVATLHDAGDRVNDDSHAMDLRGGVDFDGARFDVSLEASTELLREDHESWSVSGSARYQFAPSGRGASLSLDGIGGDASDIGLEGGYGMAMRQVHRDALLTPFAGIRHGSESGEFSSGMRLAVGDDMDADLRAARAFGNDEDTLKLTFRRTF